MKRFLIIAIAALLFASSAFAAGGGRSGGSFGGGSKSSGGGSKCCSGGSKSGGGSRSGGSSSKPTISKPSSGSKAQPKPVTRLIPKSPPPIATKTSAQTFGPLRVPPGRSYSRDRSYILRNPQYADPYGTHYYGYSGSPFFYLWLFSVMDNDRSNNALPPESDSQISPALLSYLRVIQSMDQVASP